jgi:sigma-54-specific transcriptional regulator
LTATKLASRRLHLADVSITPDAERALLEYPWPGNIRELENVIHRALLVSHDGAVTAYDLSLRGWARNEPPAEVRQQPQAAAAGPYTAPAYASPPWQGAVGEQHGAAASAAGGGHGQAAGPGAVPDTASARFHAAWRALLVSGESIEFETLQHELALAAFESTDRNQVRASKRLNISRNIMRTYLKKAGVL